MKYYDNPYQTEKWKAEKWNVVNETQKTKDQIDNDIACWVVKLTALLLALGVVYLLLKK